MCIRDRYWKFRRDLELRVVEEMIPDKYTNLPYFIVDQISSYI